MHEQYIPLLSALVGALIGAGAGIIAVWIQTRQWFQQQRWARREEYYLKLLTSLCELKVSLECRCEYFVEPGSEYDESLDESPQFQALVEEGQTALESIKRQQGVCAVYLSLGTVDTIEALLHDLRNAGHESICTADFTQSALALANNAHSAVLAEANEHLDDA